MSDYISKSALIKALKNHPNVSEEFGYIESIGLENVVETINSLPTVDEKEIIRKTVERIAERLESKKWGTSEWRDKWRDEIIGECIDVVKEEGGIE